MPTRADERSLTQVTFREFSGGLFELGHDRGVPSNGLLECTDCMPLPGGGLRAAWAWKEELLTNIPRNSRVMGFQTGRDIINNPGQLIQAALMVGTTSTAYVGPFTLTHYISAGTTALANSDTNDWNTGRTHSVNRLYPVRFTRYYTNSLLNSWYYNVAGGATTAQAGVFRTNPDLATTVVTQVYAASSNGVLYIAPHQSRLGYVVRPQDWDVLRFTNPSTDAAPTTTNDVTIGSYGQGDIGYVEPRFPNDLFVLKSRQAGFAVQGDVGAGPLVREVTVGGVPNRLTWGAKTDYGMAYMTEREGVWLWPGGSQAQHLSPQFVGSPMTSLIWQNGADVELGGIGFVGALGTGSRWLFTPKGYVYDFIQGCWFRSTLPGNSVLYSHWSFDPGFERIYGAGHREPGADLTIISASTDQSTMTRSGTFQATLPIIDMAERNVELRRIEIFGQGFGQGGTWQLEITNEQGETETTDTATAQARACSARFNTRLQGDHLKVRVLSEGATDASSSTGKSEAPMIDRIIIWLRPRQTRGA